MVKVEINDYLDDILKDFSQKVVVGKATVLEEKSSFQKLIYPVI